MLGDGRGFIGRPVDTAHDLSLGPDFSHDDEAYRSDGVSSRRQGARLSQAAFCREYVDNHVLDVPVSTLVYV